MSPAVPLLDSSRFGGGEAHISDRDIINAEVTNLDGAVDIALGEGGWGGEKPVGAVILHLSPDNVHVVAGQFVTRGTEDREIRWEAGKIWPDASFGVTITLRMPSFDSFRFSGGGLTSDLIADKHVVHFFHEEKEGGAPTPILTNNLERWGLGRFCIRLVCHPAKNSNAKTGLVMRYHLMLMPGEKATLLKMSEHVASSSWPGLRLTEGEFPVLVPPTTPWGCPFVPLLRPAVSFEFLPSRPSSASLRQAVAGIMTAGGAPETCRNPASLAAKWEKIMKSPGSFVVKPPPAAWPRQERSTPVLGKYI